MSSEHNFANFDGDSGSSYSSSSESSGVPIPQKTEKKPEVCPCPVECKMGCECKVMKVLCPHFYSAITFKDKIAYVMMTMLCVFFILLAAVNKRILFKLLLAMGVLVGYSKIVERFHDAKSYEEEAKMHCKNHCRCCSMCKCPYMRLGVYAIALVMTYFISGKVFAIVSLCIPPLAHWVEHILELPAAKAAIEKVKPVVENYKNKMHAMANKCKEKAEAKK